MLVELQRSRDAGDSDRSLGSREVEQAECNEEAFLGDLEVGRLIHRPSSSTEPPTPRSSSAPMERANYKVQV